MMRGVSTIEVVLALGIIAMTIEFVAFSSSAHAHALYSAGVRTKIYARLIHMIEDTRTHASRDGRSIRDIPEIFDGVATTSLTVSRSVHDPYNEFVFTARGVWRDDHGEYVETLVGTGADYAHAQTYDTCGTLGSIIDNPTLTQHVLAVGNILPLYAPSGHSFSTVWNVTSIDVYKGVIAVGLATTSTKLNDSIVLFDVRDDELWQYKGGIDTNSASIDGAAAIVSNGSYLFVANPHAANWSTCKQGPSCSQLQVIDIRNPGSPSIAANIELATSTGPFIHGMGGQAVGNTVSLSGTLLYLGLTKSASSTGSTEFNILDISDPVHPIWVAGYPIGATVTDIEVRDGYAYVSTDNVQRELMIFDVHNPLAPTLMTKYNAPVQYGWGNRVYAVGNQVYLGLTFSFGQPELYALHFDGSSDVSPVQTIFASSTITGIIARPDRLIALMGFSRQLAMYDTSQSIAQPLHRVSLAGSGVALECENDTLYVASQGSQSILYSVHAP